MPHHRVSGPRGSSDRMIVMYVIVYARGKGKLLGYV